MHHRGASRWPVLVREVIVTVPGITRSGHSAKTAATPWGGALEPDTRSEVQGVGHDQVKRWLHMCRADYRTDRSESSGRQRRVQLADVIEKALFHTHRIVEGGLYHASLRIR